MTAPDLGLTDTHCHLTDESFESELDLLFSRARQAGVHRIVIPGTDLQSSRAAVSLAERLPGLHAAIGVHPHDAQEWSNSTLSELRTLAQSPAVVAIGEIGLDYYRELSPRGAQRTALTGQLALARELELPVIIHNRQATEDLMQLLIEWAASLPAQVKARAGVLHAFSGDPSDAEAAIAAGFYIGVAGPVTFPKAEKLRDTLRALPVDRLLLETDAPYLAPQPRRGQRNEPSYLRFVADGLAAVLNSNTATIAELTSGNARSLFRLADGNQDTYLH